MKARVRTMLDDSFPTSAPRSLLSYSARRERWCEACAVGEFVSSTRFHSIYELGFLRRLHVFPAPCVPSVVLYTPGVIPSTLLDSCVVIHCPSVLTQDSARLLQTDFVQPFPFSLFIWQDQFRPIPYYARFLHSIPGVSPLPTTTSKNVAAVFGASSPRISTHNLLSPRLSLLTRSPAQSFLLDFHPSPRPPSLVGHNTRSPPSLTLVNNEVQHPLDSRPCHPRVRRVSPQHPYPRRRKPNELGHRPTPRRHRHPREPRCPHRYQWSRQRPWSESGESQTRPCPIDRSLMRFFVRL